MKRHNLDPATADPYRVLLLVRQEAIARGYSYEYISRQAKVTGQSLRDRLAGRKKGIPLKGFVTKLAVWLNSLEPVVEDTRQLEGEQLAKQVMAEQNGQAREAVALEGIFLELQLIRKELGLRARQ